MRNTDIGVMGFPYRMASVVIGNAMQAEIEGVDSIWYPDHIMGWHASYMWQRDGGVLADIIPHPHQYADPFVVSTATLMATRRPRVGICVTDTYRRHPVAIAQAVATLASFAPGRFSLGLGSGEGLNTTTLGIDRHRPVSRLREAVEIIQLLLSTDGPVSYQGQSFVLDRVPGMYVDPASVDIVLGGHSDALLKVVGQLGTGWLPVIPTTVERYAERLDVARRAADESGRDPDDVDAGLYAYAVIHDDPDTVDRALDSQLLRAQALAGNDDMFARAGRSHPLGAGYAGLRDFIPEHMAPDALDAAVAGVAGETAKHVIMNGTPEQVAKRLFEFAEVGVRRIVLDNLLPLGLPEELDGAAKATWSTVRSARLSLRGRDIVR